jgi:hypothetical protein
MEAHGEIRQIGLEDRQIRDASSKEGHAQERFRRQGQKSKTGHRNRIERGSKEGSKGSAAQILPFEEKAVALIETSALPIGPTPTICHTDVDTPTD